MRGGDRPATVEPCVEVVSAASGGELPDQQTDPHRVVFVGETADFEFHLKFILVEPGFKLLLNRGEHRKADRLARIRVRFNVEGDVDALVDGADVLELPEELKDFRIGSGKTRFHGRFDFVCEGNRRSKVKMIVEAVDELGEERGHPAFSETLHAVLGKDHDDAHPPAGFADFIVDVTDGVEGVARRVVVVADQMNRLVDDQDGSGIVEKILDDGGFGHVLRTENRGADLLSELVHRCACPGADVDAFSFRRPDAGVEGLSASGGAEHRGEL